MALLLRAISMVETGGNSHAVGQHGERGEFAMTPAVAAECGGYGRLEAERHARWIEKQLLIAGIDPQPFNLALVRSCAATRRWPPTTMRCGLSRRMRL